MPQIEHTVTVATINLHDAGKVKITLPHCESIIIDAQTQHIEGREVYIGAVPNDAIEGWHTLRGHFCAFVVGHTPSLWEHCSP